MAAIQRSSCRADSPIWTKWEVILQIQPKNHTLDQEVFGTQFRGQDDVRDVRRHSEKFRRCSSRITKPFKKYLKLAKRESQTYRLFQKYFSSESFFIKNISKKSGAHDRLYLSGRVAAPWSECTPALHELRLVLVPAGVEGRGLCL